MASFQIDKETVQDMVAQYGKEYTIEQLTGATRAWVEFLIEEIEVE